MKNKYGFTLIEMAIVLLIITLMVSSALGPLGAQIDLRHRAETQKALDEIKEALMGYAVANGAFPCPSAVDSSNAPTGFSVSPCTSSSPGSGYLPWATLGVTRQDAWGNLFNYSVSPNFTTKFTLTTTRSITIQSRDNNGNIINLSNPNDIPAVVFSHGANAYGAMSSDGILRFTPPGFSTNNPDEYTNSTNGTVPTSSPVFFSRTPAPAGTNPAQGGEFDDLVVWISPNILFNRMVAAGKLP
ncbi:MAG: type II secretion system protein [Sulfuriferula sp.]